MKLKRFFLYFIILSIITTSLVYLYAIQLEYELSPKNYQTSNFTNIEDIPDIITDTFVAVEDKRFYNHFGIDPIGLLRITFVAVKEGEFTQGASTITQQVARNAFLNQDRTLTRKMKEIFIAINLDYHYSKDEILESYINIAYYGNGAYGIYDASRTYFDKELDELTPEEVAFLVGVVKGPGLYPENDELATTRRNTVLFIMGEEGIISSEKAHSLMERPL